MPGPPIESWPEFVGFSVLEIARIRRAASSAFQTKLGLECCLALRGNCHALGEIADTREYPSEQRALSPIVKRNSWLSTPIGGIWHESRIHPGRHGRFSGSDPENCV